jgi:lipopolysaccharide biosynthesis protein
MSSNDSSSALPTLTEIPSARTALAWIKELPVLGRCARAIHAKLSERRWARDCQRHVRNPVRYPALPAIELITARHRTPGAEPARIAVVVHLFYPELLDQICAYLRNITEPFDLIVSTPHRELVVRIAQYCADQAESVTIAIAENRGRDIGPFVALYRSGIFSSYEMVLKVHGKKSSYSDDGARWRMALLDELCGSPEVVSKTLSIFRRDSTVGIIGPAAFYLTNERFCGSSTSILQKLLIPAQILEGSINPGFFAGSMFWFRPKAIELLNQIPESQLCFRAEDGSFDGTLAHAIERIFCPISTAHGYEISTIER